MKDDSEIKNYGVIEFMVITCYHQKYHLRRTKKREIVPSSGQIDVVGAHKVLSHSHNGLRLARVGKKGPDI